MDYAGRCGTCEKIQVCKSEKKVGYCQKNGWNVPLSRYKCLEYKESSDNICPKCGEYILGPWNFCPKCGTARPILQ